MALGIPFLLGMAILAAVLQKKIEFFNFWERLALAFSIGWGCHTIVMFVLSLNRIPLTFTNIALTDFLIAVLLFFISQIRNPHPLFSPSPQHFLFFQKVLGGWGVRAFGFFLGFIIGIKVAFVFWASFIKPVFDPDIIQCYALAAKMIYINKTFLISLPIGDKPLLPFLSQAWSVMGISPWNDTLLTLPHPFMFLSFLIIFYSVMARHFQRWYSLLFTFLLASIPFLVFQVGTAYTDFPQAFYYSIATFYLFLFMKEFKQGKEPASAYLIISAVLLALSVWVKKSGLYYAGINITVLTAFLIYNWKTIEKRDWRTFAFAAILFALIASPWLLYHQFLTFKGFYSETAASLIATAPAQFWDSKTFNILMAICRNSFRENNWHLIGTLFLSMLILFPKKCFKSPQAFLLMIVGMQLIILFTLFRFTDLYGFILDETLLNRLTFHFIPVILFFCAQVIGEGEKEILLTREE